MSKIVQEKFQEEFSVPFEDGSNYWTTDKAARTKKGLPGREGHPPYTVDGYGAEDSVMLNALPPGRDIEDQQYADTPTQSLVQSGATDVSMDNLRPGVV